MLAALGLSESDERVYLALLGRAHLGLAEIAAAVGLGPALVRDAADRLEELGFVTRLPGSPTRLVATRPEVAVGALVARRTDELSVAMQAAQQLSARFPKELRARPDELVEIVVGRAAVAARFVQLTQGATRELLVLDRPPYAQNVAATNTAETDILATGVAVRGIYDPQAFELPGAYEQALAAIRAGEDARVHGDVPLKLAIADGGEALLPLAGDGVVDSALIIRAPTVVSALVRLFELLWAQAWPLGMWDRAGGPIDNRPVDHELLALLATGAKDEAIARNLGISVRTLGRRIGRLLDALGARTRFQAGLQASRALALSPRDNPAR
jgi:sugar-specific transcriptional regulator TrmB/DNA-binding CsgD family transcriptional regulator